MIYTMYKKPLRYNGLKKKKALSFLRAFQNI